MAEAEAVSPVESPTKKKPGRPRKEKLPSTHSADNSDSSTDDEFFTFPDDMFVPLNKHEIAAALEEIKVGGSIEVVWRLQGDEFEEPSHWIEWVGDVLRVESTEGSKRIMISYPAPQPYLDEAAINFLPPTNTLPTDIGRIQFTPPKSKKARKDFKLMKLIDIPNDQTILQPSYKKPRRDSTTEIHQELTTTHSYTLKVPVVITLRDAQGIKVHHSGHWEPNHFLCSDGSVLPFPFVGVTIDSHLYTANAHNPLQLPSTSTLDPDDFSSLIPHLKTIVTRTSLNYVLMTHFAIIPRTTRAHDLELFMMWAAASTDMKDMSKDFLRLGKKMHDNLRIGAESFNSHIPIAALRQEVVTQTKASDTIEQAISKVRHRNKYKEKDKDGQTKIFRKSWSGAPTRFQKPNSEAPVPITFHSQKPRICMHCKLSHTGPWSTHQCPKRQREHGHE